MEKYIKDFKKGDMVCYYGAVFEILADATHSVYHTPRCAHLTYISGPTDCAIAQGKWVSGEVIKGYFGPGSTWGFQGNLKAGKYNVIGA